MMIARDDGGRAAGAAEKTRAPSERITFFLPALHPHFDSPVPLTHEEPAGARHEEPGAAAFHLAFIIPFAAPR